MIDISFIVLVIVDGISRIINIPNKFITFSREILLYIQNAIQQVFNEIRRTGEFTITFRIIRSIHNTSTEKFENNDDLNEDSKEE
jgi:hypothetical protein